MSDEYMPVSLSTIVVDTIIGCDLYIRNCEDNEIKYVLFCTGTKAIKKNKVEGLKKHKIENLYIRKHDHTVYLKYVEPCLERIIHNEVLSKKKKLWSYIVLRRTLWRTCSIALAQVHM